MGQFCNDCITGALSNDDERTAVVTVHAVHIQVADPHFAWPDYLQQLQITARVDQKFVSISANHKLSLAHPFHAHDCDLPFALNFGRNQILSLIYDVKTVSGV